jgi:hypothetical protein
MLGYTAWRKFRGTRCRKLLAVIGSVLALAWIVTGLAPQQSSQAAQGQKWLLGVPYAGALNTNTGACSVTVISEYLAITAAHCGTVNPVLKLNISGITTPGHNYAVKSIVKNRDLDVEALILKDRTGLTVTPLSTSVDRNVFYAWGYGRDWSNNPNNHLTRAEFSFPQLCPGDVPASGGSLCWQTNATNSVCTGDSGGPVTQNGAIIGMVTGSLFGNRSPDGKVDCSTVVLGQALTIKDMQPWLDQMIQDANPFP